MEGIIQTILFIFALIFSFYIPGRVLLGELQISIKKIQLVLPSLISGTALFILTTYILAYVNLSHLYLVVLIGLNMVFFLRRKKYQSCVLDTTEKAYLIFIFFGASVFTSLMFFSGWQTSAGLQFFDTNRVDGLLHVALIKNMTQNFPPTHPGLSEVPLQGYHYFYDFLISRFVVFFNFSPYDLYFRYMHFYVSFLYGAGFFLTASIFTKSRAKVFSVLTFAFFGQGFTFLLLIFSKDFDSMYGLAQPLGLVFNPLLIFATGMMLGAVYLFTKIEKSWKVALLVSIILGVTSQIKVHAGITGITGLAVLSAVRLAQLKSIRKVKNYIFAGVGTGLITAITFLPNNLGAGGLVYTPLVIYTHYLGQDFFAPQHWELRRRIFEQHSNIPRLTLLYLQTFAIFWILGLGLRVVIFLKSWELTKKSFWLDQKNILVMSLVLTPLIIGSLFIQSISPLDTIQFLWFALFLTSIPAGLVFGGFINTKKRYIKYPLIIILVGHSALGTFYTIYSYYQKTPRTVTLATQGVFAKVGRLPDNVTPIVLPEAYRDGETQRLVLKWEHMPIVAAFSGKSTYYEKEVAQFDLERELKKRENKVERLYTSIEECDPIKMEVVLREIDSKFIVTTNKFDCFNSKHFENVASSENYSIYKYTNAKSTSTDSN